jgi:hypothetical protein
MESVLALLVLLLALPKPSQAQNWQFEAKKNPGSDADRSFVYTASEDGDAVLAWRCMSDGLNVTVDGGYTHYGHYPQVTYHVDDAPPVGPRGWLSSTGGNSVSAPMSLVPALTKQAQRGTKLVLRIAGYTEPPHTYVFSFIGFTKQYRRLTCR